VVVLGLLLGSPGTKSHSDVDAAERCTEYYMGEGGGFPLVRAVVSFVSLELPNQKYVNKGPLQENSTNRSVIII
jgi:hypothetical protein